MIFPPLAKDLLFCLYSSTVKNKPDNQRGKARAFHFIKIAPPQNFNPPVADVKLN